MRQPLPAGFAAAVPCNAVQFPPPKRGSRRADRRLFPLAVAALAGLCLSGCALGRSVIDIQSPAAAASGSTGTAVKIVSVADRRSFEASPRSPSTPSLSDAAEINDPKITTRAVGRKRNGFGAALGDVVLPEGSTVTGLVRGGVQKALQEKGYRVVAETSPDYGAALPLSVEMQQFWAWLTPGVVSITVECQSAATMTGTSLVGTNPVQISAYVKYQSAAIFESTWADIVRRCVDDLSAKMKEKLIGS
jgi:uncharacterized lipoprotein YajG